MTSSNLPDPDIFTLHTAIWQAIASPTERYKKRFFTETFQSCKDAQGKNFLVRLVNMFTDQNTGEQWGWVESSFGICLPRETCGKPGLISSIHDLDEVKNRKNIFPKELLLPHFIARRFTVRIEPLLNWNDVEIDFVIVGFAKSGTTSLAYSLHHYVPGVEMANCGGDVSILCKSIVLVVIAVMHYKSSS